MTVNLHYVLPLLAVGVVSLYIVVTVQRAKTRRKLWQAKCEAEATAKYQAYEETMKTLAEQEAKEKLERQREYDVRQKQVIDASPVEWRKFVQSLDDLDMGLLRRNFVTEFVKQHKMPTLPPALLSFICDRFQCDPMDGDWAHEDEQENMFNIAALLMPYVVQPTPAVVQQEQAKGVVLDKQKQVKFVGTPCPACLYLRGRNNGALHLAIMQNIQSQRWSAHCSHCGPLEHIMGHWATQNEASIALVDLTNRLKSARKTDVKVYDNEPCPF